MADHTDAPTMTDGERQVIDEMLHSLFVGRVVTQRQRSTSCDARFAKWVRQ